MKIKSVKFEKTYYRYFEPFTISLGTHEDQENIEVRIELEDGTVGYGEASTLFVISGETVDIMMQVEKTVQEMILDEHVESYGKLFSRLQQLRATPAIKAAVEYAIIDAFCKRFGIKPYQFFGGATNHVETDLTVGIMDLEKTLKKVKKIYSDGFRKIKIKVGKNYKEDIERVVESKKIAPDAVFIVDANQGFTPKQAIEFAKALHSERVEVVVYEQPVNRHDVEGLKLVRFNSPYPVAADESVFTRYDALKLIKEEAVDFINIKLMKSGISDALAIVHLAQSNNVQLMIGCMGESSLGITQSIHFAAGTGAFAYHDLDAHLSLNEKVFRGDFKQEGPHIYLT
ncbi:L-Ala-D/L-Glu epimerase [Pseudothermotoga sp.]|uniref:L-Ala-D/L-Glu epimerase n=1 Tax=Pseudothermotoga sp. TaxID=2033661 RepID=UPI0031F6088A